MISVCVDPAGVHEAWPHFKDKIEKAITKVGLTDFSAVEEDVLSGRALLWLAYEAPDVYAAAVTQLINNTLEIVACGGDDLHRFMPLLKDLEQFGRDEGCKACRIIGRKGWTRVLNEYKTKAIILERPL